MHAPVAIGDRRASQSPCSHMKLARIAQSGPKKRRVGKNAAHPLSLSFSLFCSRCLSCPCCFYILSLRLGCMCARVCVPLLAGSSCSCPPSFPSSPVWPRSSTRRPTEQQYMHNPAEFEFFLFFPFLISIFFLLRSSLFSSFSSSFFYSVRLFHETRSTSGVTKTVRFFAHKKKNPAKKQHFWGPCAVLCAAGAPPASAGALATRPHVIFKIQPECPR